MLIGLVGQIGSGKSEVAAIFKKFGACVISADKIGREVVDNNPAVLKKLIKSFGPEIVTTFGRLKRKHLGRLAFSDTAAKSKLDAIVHPYLLKELARQSKKALRNNNLVIIDAALLVDWGWHKRVDLTILVHAKREILISRLRRKGYTKTEALNRLKLQKSYSELKKAADLIVYNNGSIAELQQKVLRIINRLTQNGLTLY